MAACTFCCRFTRCSKAQSPAPNSVLRQPNAATPPTGRISHWRRGRLSRRKSISPSYLVSAWLVIARVPALRTSLEELPRIVGHRDLTGQDFRSAVVLSVHGKGRIFIVLDPGAVQVDSRKTNRVLGSRSGFLCLSSHRCPQKRDVLPDQRRRKRRRRSEIYSIEGFACRRRS